MLSKFDLSFLIVDDFEASLRMMKSLLRQLGYKNIHTCNNGEEALELLNSMTVDVIITDWDMPKVSGFELLAWVRTHDIYEGIPVIMLTAQSDAESVMRALDAGAADYIVKPFTPLIFEEKIEIAVNKKLGSAGL